jgi:TonB family protein
LSPSTKIELQGPGGGGVPYGNFLAAVKKIYTDAWEVPEGVSDDAAATVSVTIARDGTVISARIIKSSDNSKVDQSVQTVLDRVKYAAPLPENAKEDQRTVNIVFDVKSKLIG